jgi:hypothetical protein
VNSIFTGRFVFFVRRAAMRCCLSIEALSPKSPPMYGVRILTWFTLIFKALATSVRTRKGFLWA